MPCPRAVPAEPLGCHALALSDVTAALARAGSGTLSSSASLCATTGEAKDVPRTWTMRPDASATDAMPGAAKSTLRTRLASGSGTPRRSTAVTAIAVDKAAG